MIRCVCLWEMVFYLFIVKEEHMRILSWFLSFMCIGRSTQILVIWFYCFWFHSKSSYFRFFICLKVDLEKKSIFLETMRKIVFLNVNLPSSSAVVVTEGWHEPTLTKFQIRVFFYRFCNLISMCFEHVFLGKIKCWSWVFIINSFTHIGWQWSLSEVILMGGVKTNTIVAAMNII